MDYFVRSLLKNGLPFIIYKNISPGWIYLEYPEIVSREEAVSELDKELKQIIPLFFNKYRRANLYTVCSLIDKNPTLLLDKPILRNMSRDYKKFTESLYHYDYKEITTNKLYAFNLGKMFGIPLEYLDILLFQYPSELFKLGVISKPTLDLLDHSWFRYYSCLLHIFLNHKTGSIIVSPFKVMLFQDEGNYVYQLLFQLYEEGIDVNLELVKDSTIHLRWKKGPSSGFYLTHSGKPYPLTSNYIAPEIDYFISSEDSSIEELEAILYTLPKLKWDEYQVYTHRDSFKIYKGERIGLEEFFLLSNLGISVDLDLVNIYSKNPLQPSEIKSRKEWLKEIRDMLLIHPSPYSEEYLKNQFFKSIQLRAVSWMGNVSRQLNPIQSSILMIGTVPEIFFILTRTYSFPYISDRLMDSTINQLTRLEDVDPIIESKLNSLSVPKVRDGINLYIQWKNYTLSTYQIATILGKLYSLTTYRTKITPDHFRSWIEEDVDKDLYMFDLIRGIKIPNSSQLGELEKVIHRLGEVRMLDLTGVFTPLDRYIDLIFGKPGIFLVPCQSRTCINATTPTFLEKTMKIKTKLPIDDPSHRIFYNQIKDKPTHPLIGLGDLKTYTCSTIEEIEAIMESGNLTLFSSLTDNPYRSVTLRIKDLDTLNRITKKIGYFPFQQQYRIYQRRIVQGLNNPSLVKFKEEYLKLALDQRRIVDKFVLLVELVIMYGRRWRGPGWDYPYKSSETMIPCLPSIPVQYYSSFALSLYKDADLMTRKVLESIQCIALSESTLMFKSDNVLTELSKILGDRTSAQVLNIAIPINPKPPQCIRVSIFKYLSGIYITYGKILGINLPGLDQAKLEDSVPQDEYERTKDFLKKKEPPRIGIMDYTYILSKDIPLYILSPVHPTEEQIKSNLDLFYDSGPLFIVDGLNFCLMVKSMIHISRFLSLL